MPGIEARQPERTRHQQRILRVAERLAGQLADVIERLLHCAFNAGG